jgi:plasmid stability protein
MKTIQVRNVPDELHRAIKVRAAQEGLSITDYVRRELERLVSRPSMKEVLARIKEQEPVLGGPSSADLIREDRGPLPNE